MTPGPVARGERAAAPDRGGCTLSGEDPRGCSAPAIRPVAPCTPSRAALQGDRAAACG